MVFLFENSGRNGLTGSKILISLPSWCYSRAEKGEGSDYVVVTTTTISVPPHTHTSTSIEEKHRDKFEVEENLLMAPIEKFCRI
jgi:hypothetical protein